MVVEGRKQASVSEQVTPELNREGEEELTK